MRLVVTSIEQPIENVSKRCASAIKLPRPRETLQEMGADKTLGRRQKRNVSPHEQGDAQPIYVKFTRNQGMFTDSKWQVAE